MPKRLNLDPGELNPLAGICSRQLGLTGWCSAGRHENCAHSPGGAQEAGHWQPECYLTLPTPAGRGHSKDERYVPHDGRSYVAVISPSHLYRCPCSCHADAQAGNPIRTTEGDPK